MIEFIQNCLHGVSQKLNIIANLTAENIALRHQLVVLKRSQDRAILKNNDRLFWVILSRIWSGWRSAIMIVQPDTVVRWHKKSFKSYWRRKSQQGKRGRPSLDPDIRSLVLKMAKANHLWGAPKIHGELLKLGIEISERTVSGLISRHILKSPSQTWKTFIKNHMTDMVAVDFLVVPTVRFKILYVFIVLSHARRQVIHFNVTANPTAQWTANQVIEEVMTAFHSPWQNAYVERLNGSIRRECTDPIIALNENHLRKSLRTYFEYYHENRTHLGLNKETPLKRAISNKSSPAARLLELPRLGGLHHLYEWGEAA